LFKWTAEMRNGSACKVNPDSASIPDILTLVQQAFASMEARIDPPSSMHRLTVSSIRDACAAGEVWTIGDKPDACIFTKKKGDYLYIGKLSVREDMRGRGLARALVELAETRAKMMGLSGLELETRIELTENHETFRRLGFVKSGEGAHKGFERSTYIIMRKNIAAD